MQMTDLTRGFAEYLGLDVDTMQDAECGGLAAVMFVTLRACIPSGTDVAVAECAAFGRDHADSLEYTAWRWIAEQDSPDLYRLMMAHLRKHYSILNSEYWSELVYRAYAYVIEQPVMQDGVFDQKRAIAGRNFQEERLKEKGVHLRDVVAPVLKQMAKTLQDAAAEVMSRITIERAIEVLRNHPEVRSVPELMKNLPTLIIECTEK